jgi:truncated hemoglobin YjbI
MNEETFLVDQEDYYSLLGDDLIVRLSNEFYTRVYNDDVLWFKSIFPKGGKEVIMRL